MVERGPVLPNFLVVGAARSGTTSLFYYLLQHPDIFMPSQKECMFFSGMQDTIAGKGAVFKKGIIKTLDEYQKLFLDVQGKRVVGEISPDYLYHSQESIKNIRSILGDQVRIVIVLRNPIDRAYSHYLHHVRYGAEDLSFEDALAAEGLRKEQGYFWAYQYAGAGLYHDQVKAYLDSFPHVRIYLYDDLKKDALGLMRDLYGYLGVDPEFAPDIRMQYNVSGDYRSRFLKKVSQGAVTIKQWLYPLFRRISMHARGRQGLEKIMSLLLEKPKMRTETRALLRERFRDDVVRTGRLIDRDLSSWLS